MKNEKLTTIELIESTRKTRIKENEDKTIELIKTFYDNMSSINDNNVWESLKNGIINSSELLDVSPEDYIEILINEYNGGSILAKKIILDLGKDPLRQNLSEEIQEKVALNNGVFMKKLPQSGKNSLHVFNGKILKKCELSDEEKGLASKALDFQIINTDKYIYTYNKYNKWVGGSTDDVKKDIRKLIDEFLKVDDKSIKLIIILDGYYWELNRIDFIKYNCDNLLIIDSDNLNKQIIL